MLHGVISEARTTAMNKQPMSNNQMLVHELAIMSQLQHHDYMPPLPALMAQCASILA